MRHYIFRLGLTLSSLAGSIPAAAHAAPVNYDCDVPAHRFSSVTQQVSGPAFSTAGVISVVEMRRGSYLPVAGVRMTSPDNRQIVGFQLVAESARTNSLNIVLNTGEGSDISRGTVGKIAIGDAIPFRLSLSDSGAVTLTVGNETYSRDFVQLPSVEIKVFCSTGQFKFSDLTFVSLEPAP